MRGSQIFREVNVGLAKQVGTFSQGFQNPRSHISALHSRRSDGRGPWTSSGVADGSAGANSTISMTLSNSSVKR